MILNVSIFIKVKFSLVFLCTCDFMVVIHIQQRTYVSKLTCLKGILSNIVVRTNQNASPTCCKVLPAAELPMLDNFILFITFNFYLKMSLLGDSCPSILFFFLRVAIIQKLKVIMDVLLTCFLLFYVTLYKYSGQFFRHFFLHY